MHVLPTTVFCKVANEPFSCVQGTNLDSVEHEEIVVTVGGKICINIGFSQDTVSSSQVHI